MQRLPVCQADGKSLLPSQVPVPYLSPVAVLQSRDIDKKEYWGPPGQSHIQEDNALPTVLLLLSGRESDDPSLVLNIADSKFGIAARSLL